MNKKRGMIMVVLFLGVVMVIGAGLYFRGGNLFVTTAQKQPPPSEHLGHGGSVPPQQAVPEESGAAFPEEAPTVEIPEAGQRFIGVKTTEVVEKSIDKSIRTVGRVEYDERRIATVNTKIGGWIETLRVNYTGRYVTKGEVLAEIYSPELVAAQQEYLNILKWARPEAAPTGTGESSGMSRMLAEDAEAMRQAARQRLRFLDLTEAQINKIEQSGAPLRTLAVFSPVSGYVVQKAALQGMKVEPGEKLFDLVDISTVWLVADIYEQELALVHTGQKASISLASLPGREFVSTIEYVSPLLAGETRTAKIRFTLDNRGAELKPQMFANVEIRVPLGKRLVVPDSAVLNTGARQLVYVDKGDGYFEPREVGIGVRGAGMSEILTGLEAGEKVASAATFLIDSEARLKGVVQ